MFLVAQGEVDVREGCRPGFPVTVSAVESRLLRFLFHAVIETFYRRLSSVQLGQLACQKLLNKGLMIYLSACRRLLNDPEAQVLKVDVQV